MLFVSCLTLIPLSVSSSWSKCTPRYLKLRGFKELKGSHKCNSFMKLKMVNCLTSNVTQNYKEKDHLRYGTWWLFGTEVAKVGERKVNSSILLLKSLERS